MLFLKPENFSDYQLIDSGSYKKLEKFGSFILSRPEPQAVWDTSLSENEWDKLSHAEFRKETGNPDKGEWVLKKGMKEQWFINYNPTLFNIRFRLGLTSFKHVGIFPEQAANWDYIYKKVHLLGNTPKVLNLFAYTGGASLVAKAAGADVSHVDSVKQVITWGKENMEASNLKDIRWVVEDAMKYVQREVRRGNQYQGIILDPPAYGRGPNGEKWIIEDQLNEILKGCRDLLDKKNHFFILNLYSIGFSALIVETLLKSIFGDIKNPEIGELYLEDKAGKKLPLSIFGRFSSV
ncbi:MAG TPA: class I SAM-dependent methyltransferase [Cytophagaceae bacterium]|jgi:23S rRNA (cytosine1962-C5)-methyltransferase|nr:class I SAM-dependent methyltransferase [Cytophagaceae bacterium]